MDFRELARIRRNKGWGFLNPAEFRGFWLAKRENRRMACKLWEFDAYQNPLCM
jgi:hypothetical protein